MVKISQQAVQQLQEYRDRRGPESCVRIGILSGSTTGPSLGISIDDRKETDEIFEYGELRVIIDRPLLEYCEEISVDYVLQKGGGCSSGGGFQIRARNPV